MSGMPAIRSSSVNMSSILDSYVDLTARPVCHHSDPEIILDIQQSLSRERSNKFPILQVVIID